VKRLALIICLALATPASAAQLLVVGRGGDTLLGPKAVKAGKQRVRRCRVPARTPLAALLATSLKVRVRDYGGCDPGGLYVFSVQGQRERGRDGWVYKTGHGTPSVGAATVKAKRVLWFWCANGKHGCQRTLEAVPDRDEATPGEELRVTVTAYDDDGKGVRAKGATVKMGSASATANDAGVATLNVPPGAGARKVVATQSGRVRSFPATVEVG
jgi:hypothetical protein